MTGSQATTKPEDGQQTPKKASWSSPQPEVLMQYGGAGCDTSGSHPTGFGDRSEIFTRSHQQLDAASVEFDSTSVGRVTQRCLQSTGPVLGPIHYRLDSGEPTNRPLLL